MYIKKLCNSSKRKCKTKLQAKNFHFTSTRISFEVFTYTLSKGFKVFMDSHFLCWYSVYMYCTNPLSLGKNVLHQLVDLKAK